MTHLLDINVLVALFDAAHAHHDAAHRWFAAVGAASWATCPMTENGLAARQGGKLATFDEHIPLGALVNVPHDIALVIPA